MKIKLNPITILLPLEIIKQIENEAKQSGIPKSINLRNIIIKHYANKTDSINT